MWSEFYKRTDKISITSDDILASNDCTAILPTSRKVVLSWFAFRPSRSWENEIICHAHLMVIQHRPGVMPYCKVLPRLPAQVPRYAITLWPLGKYLTELESESMHTVTIHSWTNTVLSCSLILTQSDQNSSLTPHQLSNLLCMQCASYSAATGCLNF